MAGPPERIFIQWTNADHEHDPASVTWCEDRVFEDDIEYVRKDIEIDSRTP